MLTVGIRMHSKSIQHLAISRFLTSLLMNGSLATMPNVKQSPNPLPFMQVEWIWETVNFPLPRLLLFMQDDTMKKEVVAGDLSITYSMYVTSQLSFFQSKCIVSPRLLLVDRSGFPNSLIYFVQVIVSF